MRKRIHAYLEGRVQGVFFRVFAKTEAEELGIDGWIENLNDGRLEVVAEGEEKKLMDYIEVLKKGPPLSNVTKIDVNWEISQNQLVGFQIKK